MAVRPFITVENGKYVLHEDTALWLGEQSEHFAVLACGGKYRGGKSYMLNRLLNAAPSKGFGVGETVQACTRGISLHTTFLEGDGKRVLVMDTEGIDALDAECSHDVRIIAISVLISSIFVYNSMSHLDEAAIQSLSLMTRVAESLDDEHHPTLYWVLRDFSLLMVNASGDPITHADYLEQALQNPTAEKCATREAIRSLFPERHLVTLPRPHKGESSQRLDSKAASARNPKFDTHLDVFRKHVLQHAKLVSAAGVPLTGNVYVSHVRYILSMINQTGKIPTLQDAWTLLSTVHHQDAETNARKELCMLADTMCPTGSHKVVWAWVVDVCTHKCAHMSFLPPRPDVDAMTSRLADEVLVHCKALGRVKDLRALAEEAAEACFQKFRESNYNSIDALLHFSLAEECRVQFDACVARRFVEELEAIKTAYVREGQDRCLEESHLKLEDAKLQLQHLASQLEEERAQPRLSTNDVRSATMTCDVATMTDEFDEDDSEGREQLKEAVRLQSALTVSEEEVRRTNEEIEEARRKEATMQHAFRDGMDRLQEETLVAITALKTERDEALSERNTALSTSKTRADQKAAIEWECEKMRELAREAQKHTIEIQKSTLEELRRRDSEARALMEKQMRECNETQQRADCAEQEARATKRRIDELLHIQEANKRLSSMKDKAEVERDLLRAGLDRGRSEMEVMRRQKYDMENRLAILEASTKLETCKRALL